MELNPKEFLKPEPNDPFKHELDFARNVGIRISYMESYIVISKVRFDGRKKYAFDIYNFHYASDYQRKKLTGFLMFHSKHLHDYYG